MWKMRSIEYGRGTNYRQCSSLHCCYAPIEYHHCWRPASLLPFVPKATASICFVSAINCAQSKVLLFLCS